MEGDNRTPTTLRLQVYLYIILLPIGGSCDPGWIRHRPFQVAGE